MMRKFSKIEQNFVNENLRFPKVIQVLQNKYQFKKIISNICKWWENMQNYIPPP
jgi:hypothetical protein